MDQNAKSHIRDLGNPLSNQLSARGNNGSTTKLRKVEREDRNDNLLNTTNIRYY
jgi:hypothetical protein